ncbi:MAG: Glucose-phosphate thymidylyltransferase [Acidobacteria bacterium]|nr:Glucose-phosphate thymidylyltransferase [Acidobacteriota bacterium]
MKLIILAAGYATRLYPLTLNRPKPLLPVAGKPMIEHLLEHLRPIEAIDHVYIVTNAKYADQFGSWSIDYHANHGPLDFTIVNDRSTDDSNRLGAIGDLSLVLNQEQITDDIIVVGGDNLMSQSLAGFGQFCGEREAPVLAVYDVGDLNEVKKYNAIDVEPDGQIRFFEEKPAAPTSTLIGIALYYYPARTLPLIKQYLEEGNNPDQPGRLVQWMYRRTPFYTWRVPGIWYDVGSKETLEEANQVFAKGQ